MTLIGADNDFALIGVLFAIAGGAFLAEKTRIGSHLTGAVIAILAAIAAAKGSIRLSRFFKSANAALRADRGPRPGNFASSRMSRSISSPTGDAVMR